MHFKEKASQTMNRPRHIQTKLKTQIVPVMGISTLLVAGQLKFIWLTLLLRRGRQFDAYAFTSSETDWVGLSLFQITFVELTTKGSY